MGRPIWANGMVFDDTGADASVADIAVEEGRIVDIGVGLDGDESVDLAGHLVTPGLFYSHVHFIIDGDLSPTTYAKTPFSMRFYLAAERMRRTLATGITTVREAGGSDLGVKEAQEKGLVEGPRMQVDSTHGTSNPALPTSSKPAKKSRSDTIGTTLELAQFGTPNRRNRAHAATRLWPKCSARSSLR